MTSAKDGINNELASFDYDFERKRLSKTGVSGLESYVYAGNQIVNEYNAFGTQTAKYTIGAGEVVKSEFGNTENNYHFTDALGSVTSLAKLSDGSLTTRNEYNAFGEVATNGASANSIGYTGQRLDAETGLMALGNGERYYSPSLARFIQQDTWLGDSQMPQSTNLFAYAYNNPFSYTDPSGNQPEGKKDETAEWFRETREAVRNHGSGNWWTDYVTFNAIGRMEGGYGGYQFVKEFARDSVVEPVYGRIDQAKDAYYNAVGTDYKDRSYWGKTYQAEQQKIIGGMSVLQAKWETAKAQIYSAVTLGLGPLVEKVGKNAIDYYDGRIDITEYNIGQGEALAEGAVIYAMARGTRALMEGAGAGKPMTFRESLQSLKSEVSSLKSSGSRALTSIRENVGKVFSKNSGEFNTLRKRGLSEN